MDRYEVENCLISASECTENRLAAGLCPDTLEGAYSAPPDPLDGFMGEGKKGKRDEKRRGRKRSGSKGRYEGKERRECKGKARIGKRRRTKKGGKRGVGRKRKDGKKGDRRHTHF